MWLLYQTGLNEPPPLSAHLCCPTGRAGCSLPLLCLKNKGTNEVWAQNRIKIQRNIPFCRKGTGADEGSNTCTSLEGFSLGAAAEEQS